MAAEECLPNYFTCTLGEAQSIHSRHNHQFDTINHFLDEKASVSSNDPAVGFPIPRSDPTKEWSSEVFSFKDLREGSIAIANSLQVKLGVQNKGELRQPPCIALLCPSSVDFLFVWLGLMREGYSVLLIAPQCQPEAIASLCQDCHASTLIYHASYDDLAISAMQSSQVSLRGIALPWQLSKDKVRSLIQQKESSSATSDAYHLTSGSVAYIHHTSGTSSLHLKPIPQTHHAAIGVLPCLPPTSKATFTTTPLYHGGIADCFRAWTSGELIWLFPGGEVPITDRNIIFSLKATELRPQVPVKYFSSVPYVLQMLALNDDGIKWLMKMDIVGVGGAALPQNVGDDLVKHKVHLVSRFGSAECGFLLSSHRDYETDSEWQYLRLANPSPSLQFERHNDRLGLFELIVLKGWPHRAKTNRDNGSFATSDLFQPHETIGGAWKYHSRSDNQITLITGKKFDPTPIEDVIVASASEIKDAFVFGNGRQVPGIFVFVNKDAGENVSHTIWSAVCKANSKLEAYARIDQDMVITMRYGQLMKSSKGTVMRKAAEETFAKEIESAYQSNKPADFSWLSEGRTTKQKVRDIVNKVVGRDLEDVENFFDCGVDSQSCTRIRALLQECFLTPAKTLPWNVVYDCGNIETLSLYLEHRAQENPAWEINISKTEEMLQMVKQFSKPRINDGGQVVILTGATGSLGAHILKVLLENTEISRVYCLIRARSNREAENRLLKNLQNRQIPCKDSIRTRKVQGLASSLHDTNMGLDPDMYLLLKERATLIIHAAWPVNFLLPLSEFRPSFQGLHNLFALIRANPLPTSPTFLFCSSTAAIWEHPTKPIPESISTSPSDASALGYAQSKWVAESICNAKKEQFPHSKIKIARIGQLTGDTENGIWNMNEAYPLMLSTIKDLGCLPAISDSLDWLPLDGAARAVVDIALSDVISTQEIEDEKEPPRYSNAEVYHVLNKFNKPTFSDLLQWLKEINTMDAPFEVVEPRLWMDRLECLKENHPAKSLLGFWRKAYGDHENTDSKRDGKAGVAYFSTEEAEKRSEFMRNVKEVDKELVGKIWGWLETEER